LQDDQPGWCPPLNISIFQRIHRSILSLGIKAARREERAIAEARQEWDPIFGFAAGNGTNGPCPVLSPDEVADAIRDMNGTQSTPKADKVKESRLPTPVPVGRRGTSRQRSFPHAGSRRTRRR
jgi:hypothetical protein